MRLLLLASLLFSAASATARAQSTSKIRLSPRPETAEHRAERWYAKPMTTRIGEVAEFDNRQLAVILAGEAVETRFPAERVLSIEWDEVPADQRDALNAFRDGNYTEALKGLVASVSNKDPARRPPVWRQQWLSMLAAQAAWRSGRGAIAFELIEQLDQRPMPPLVWTLLPVDWLGTTKSQPLLDAAAKRARSDSLAVKLVAASWLLGSTKYRDAAESAIGRLANLEPSPISLLAKQLSWRTKTPVELTTQWTRWRSDIEALPMPLRSGPLLGFQASLQAAGLGDAARQQKLILETVAPTWHPDLPTPSRDRLFPSR